MEEGRASGTATVAAMMRAAHPAFDPKPWIFNDDLAAPLAGLDDVGSVRAALDGVREQLGRTVAPELLESLSQSMRLCPAVRARYAEDMLAAAIERGVSQYVILGAGLDSFAYRSRDLAASLRIFEVDYPATQDNKRARLRELNIEIPANLSFVPIDFEKDLILQVLEDAGFKRDEPAFFSWLGVTFFLTDEAIDNSGQHGRTQADGARLKRCQPWQRLFEELCQSLDDLQTRFLS